MAESSGVAEVPSGEPGGRQLSLADKLNHLFETVKNPATGRKYTNAEVSRLIREASGEDGPTVSESAIAQLRSGVKPNPTVRTVEALARHFHVASQYFFPDYDPEESAKIRASMELIETVRNGQVRGIALRANGLSASSLAMINSVIEHARNLEGLDKTEE
ncbi:transcriptional regulator [Streptomyces sp. NPDC087851]|uniref:transcriptional regulator n=1 Tax=Streptomyces sp. NPDC087851 TaxID=3365810 RepID=UPI003829EBC6